MNLLICGDSFSYYNGDANSWVTKIHAEFNATNLSSCGIGEYKIFQQLKSVDLNNYDKILISHGSPTRLYINQEHSLHTNKIYKNSDLIFADVEIKKDKNDLANAAYNYFLHIFDIEYYRYMHNLICADIDNFSKSRSVIHITHFDYTNLYQFDNTLIELYNTWIENKGTINHYNVNGNNIVFNRLLKTLCNSNQTLI